jgi:hypothetical protein
VDVINIPLIARIRARDVVARSLAAVMDIPKGIKKKRRNGNDE